MLSALANVLRSFADIVVIVAHPSETLGNVKRFALGARLAFWSNEAMIPRDHLIRSWRELCEREGGYTAIADRIGVNDQTLWQVINGTKLPSGQPRGVGPAIQRKLEQHYPGWSSAPALRYSVQESAAAYLPARDPYDTTVAMADALGRLPPLKRPELVQVFALLVEYPDEPDYIARFAKLLDAGEHG